MQSESNSANHPDADQPGTESEISSWRELLTSEDWWAVWIGGLILLVGFLAVYVARPDDIDERAAAVRTQQETLRRLRTELNSASTVDESLKEESAEVEKHLKELRGQVAPNPLKPWLTKIQKWSRNPLDGFRTTRGDETVNLFPAVVTIFGIGLVLFGTGLKAMGTPFGQYACGFVFVFALSVVALILASQELVKLYNLEYPLWALLVGLIISNTIGTPAFVKPAVKTEFYIKTGLVLLGAKILLSRLLALGMPGVFVAWVVTPVVLVSTYAFGQKVLRIESRSLNMTISADMSVCGVSAAIATAAACRAKKEELTLTISMSLMFTVMMMTLMPPLIKSVGMSDVLAGAWMGGTIDATGAVAAAGAFLGGTAEEVAILIKMIQNILIGVIAFCVAIYWVIYVEPSSQDAKPSVWEIWYRFPKFVIGFVLASISFSILSQAVPHGQSMVDSMIKGTSDVLRSWFFCLAFVSIGLDTNFAELGRYLKGGKPLVLYICGQTLNLCLTLAMAWLMFEVVFKEAVTKLVQ